MHGARRRRVFLEHIQRGCIIKALSVLRGDDPRVSGTLELEPVRPLAIGNRKPSCAVGRLVVEDEDPIPLAVRGE